MDNLVADCDHANQMGPSELVLWSRNRTREVAEACLTENCCDLDDDAASAYRDEAVTILLAAHTREDLGLVRALLRAEIAARRASDGCGDALYGLCYMLYSVGDLDDLLLIYEAKCTNFDAGAMIDRQMLTMRRDKHEVIRFVEAAVSRNRHLALQFPNAVQDVTDAFDSPDYGSVDDFAGYVKGYFGIS